MSRLTRDGTAEPVSRDQILRHARGQGILILPVQLTTSRIGILTRLIHTLLFVMTIHTTYIQPAHLHTQIRLNRWCLHTGFLPRSAAAPIDFFKTAIRHYYYCVSSPDCSLSGHHATNCVPMAFRTP